MMSDAGRTEPIPAHGTSTARDGDDLSVSHEPTGATAEQRTGPSRAPASSASDRDANPLTDTIEAAKNPDNRAKLLLATALLGLLNLLLLIAVLVNVLGDDYEQVTVDGQPCIVQLGDGESVLYCQR
jgi:hypothetical protein